MRARSLLNVQLQVQFQSHAFAAGLKINKCRQGRVAADTNVNPAVTIVPEIEHQNTEHQLSIIFLPSPYSNINSLSMPVTRSNSRQLHAGGPLLATPSPRRPIQRKRRPTDNDDDSDVIVLSSGDEEVRKIKQRPIKPRPKTRTKHTPSVDDIVEISSDDDQAPNPTVSSLQKKLYKLEKVRDSPESILSTMYRRSSSTGK